MTVILDSGGVTALASQRIRVAELRRKEGWPPIVPAAVLVECLTGDHRRDFETNRFLATCQIRPVSERVAREAATLRTATGRASEIAATDAIVAAQAAQVIDPVVVTSDTKDLRALAAHTKTPLRIVGV